VEQGGASSWFWIAANSEVFGFVGSEAFGGPET
jgi:hypothetical protein